VAKLNEKMALTPGEVRQIVLEYVDQTNKQKISASDIVQPLVASTHYKFGSTKGSSSDLNADLTITLDAVGGNSATLTLENTGTKLGYVNLLQLEGYIVNTQNAVTDSLDSNSGFSGRVLNFDMPYCSDSRLARNVRDYLYLRISDTDYQGARVSFNANKSAALMAAALSGDVSTHWTIRETLTALTGDWNINGYECSLGVGGRLDVTWWVVPCRNISSTTRTAART